MNKPEGVIPSYRQIEELYKSGAITADQVKTLSQRRKALDDLNANLEYAGEWGRQLIGTGLTAIGALPIFNAPVTGAIGGATSALGQGIQHHHTGREIARDMGAGAALGGALGYAGRFIPKSTTAGQNLVKNLAKREVPAATPQIKKAIPTNEVPIEKALNILEKKPNYTSISLKEYLTKENPEVLTNDVPHIGFGAELLSKYGGVPRDQARNYVANTTFRNVNDLYLKNNAYGGYNSIGDYKGITNNVFIPRNPLDTFAHEEMHQVLRALDDSARAGNRSADELVEKLYNIGGSNTPVGSNEIIPRAVEGLIDKGYKTSNSILERYGGNTRDYQNIQNALKPDYTEFLFNRLLGR